MKDKLKKLLKQEQQVQKEQQKINQRIELYGITLEQYEELVFKGQWKTWKQNFLRQRYKERRIRARKFFCPRCCQLVKDLDRWPAHGNYCLDCVYTDSKCIGCGNTRKRLDTYSGVEGLCEHCIGILKADAKRRKISDR